MNEPTLSSIDIGKTGGKSPRILILSASVGAGHGRAADAVARAIKSLEPSAEVRHEDILDFTNAVFRRLYGQAYFDLFHVAPHMLGYIYDWLDRAPKNGRPVGDQLRFLAEKINLRSFTKFLREGSWDMVVNTHFLPAEMLAALRRSGQTQLPQVTVTTDFETHRLWVNNPCDHYFVATSEGASNLKYWGVPAGDISVSGIPVDPVFSRKKSQDLCRTIFQLEDNRPTILQLAGGFGIGPLEEVYRALLDVRVPINLFVVTGRNEEAKREIEQFAVPFRHRVKILGFTNQMDELMGAADLVISKPGGLTSSECLARGVPMAIVNPIPGQESRNSDFLLENGAAIKINSIFTLTDRVTELLLDPAKLQRMKANAASAAKPLAAFTVAQSVLDLVKRNQKLVSSSSTHPLPYAV